MKSDEATSVPFCHTHNISSVLNTPSYSQDDKTCAALEICELAATPINLIAHRLVETQDFCNVAGREWMNRTFAQESTIVSREILILFSKKGSGMDDAQIVRWREWQTLDKFCRI